MTKLGASLSVVGEEGKERSRERRESVSVSHKHLSKCVCVSTAQMHL